MLGATLRWVKEPGLVLKPHRYRNGKFGTDEFKGGDWKCVSAEEKLRIYLQRDWSIRMSNPESAQHRGASLIVPRFVRP